MANCAIHSMVTTISIHSGVAKQDSNCIQQQESESDSIEIAVSACVQYHIAT